MKRLFVLVTALSLIIDIILPSGLRCAEFSGIEEERRLGNLFDVYERPSTQLQAKSRWNWLNNSSK